MSKGVVVSVCSPLDEVRGSVLRLRVLLNQLKQSDKWVYCPSLFKSGTVFADGVTIEYYPLTMMDIFTAAFLFFRGRPITNIIFQRRNMEKSQKGVEKFVFHLSRTVQSGNFSGELTVDLCESLAENYRLRGRLLSKFSIKRLFFNFEAERLEKFELSLAKNSSIATQFISKNDSLIPQAINYSVLPNSLASVPVIKRLDPIDQKRIVFLGQLDYEPNLYSIYRTSKLFSELDSSYELHVVGSFNKSTKKKLSKLKNVVSHGFVDHLEEIMPQSLCGVALIDNVTGMQNKVLDYFFYGIPALVSKDVYDGLPSESPALVVTNIDELRSTLKMCLSDKYRANLQVLGYEYLEKIKEN